MPALDLNEEVRKLSNSRNRFNNSVVDARDRFQPKKEEEEEPAPPKKRSIVRWELEITERDDRGAIRKIALIPVREEI